MYKMLVRKIIKFHLHSNEVKLKQKLNSLAYLPIFLKQINHKQIYNNKIKKINKRFQEEKLQLLCHIFSEKL